MGNWLTLFTYPVIFPNARHDCRPKGARPINAGPGIVDAREMEERHCEADTNGGRVFALPLVLVQAAHDREDQEEAQEELDGQPLQGLYLGRQVRVPQSAVHGLWNDGLHAGRTGHSARTLHQHVQDGPNEADFADREQGHRYCGVYVAARNVANHLE